MLAPQGDVHVAVGPPRVGFGQEWPLLPDLVGTHPVQEEPVPLVEVRQDVAQVLVPAPVRLLPALVGGEVEGGRQFVLGHGGSKLHELPVPVCGCGDQLVLARRSRHDTASFIS